MLGRTFGRCLDLHSGDGTFEDELLSHIPLKVADESTTVRLHFLREDQQLVTRDDLAAELDLVNPRKTKKLDLRIPLDGHETGQLGRRLDHQDTWK